MKLTKSEALKAIDKAYSRLCGCCESTTKWDRWIAIIQIEEKAHRKFCPSHVQCGLTLKQAIRQYAVSKMFERLTGGPIPEAKDFFSLRGSLFGACAIADICQVELLKEFSEPEMLEWLDSVDYCELNKDPKTT